MHHDNLRRKLNREFERFLQIDQTVASLQTGAVISFFAYLFFIWWSDQALSPLVYLTLYLMLVTTGRFMVLSRLARLHVQRARTNNSSHRN
ncbi:MAG: hypothetical protein WBA12_12785 [Catalinimonas sp.]